MKIRQAPRLRFFCLIAALTVLAVRDEPHASPAVPQCTVAGLSSLGVRDMRIVSATQVPAAPPNPSYCDVHGSVTTSGNGAADGSAGFEIKLPGNWNHKFLFLGVGGLAGSLNPEANRSDVAQSLTRGYATAITDAGHQAFVLDGSWALESPGVPDRPKLVDYLYRAAHDVTIAAKHLVEGYFDGDIRRSYFDGCSNGGRMGLMEATRFPEDYDGIIAGAPFLDMRVAIGTAKVMKQILTLPDEINYTGGVEFIASPRLTVMGDVIGRTLRGAGHLDLVSKKFEYNEATELITGVPGPGCAGFVGWTCKTASFDEFDPRPGNLALLLGSGGVKFNPAGNLLISASVLFPLTNAGLRSRVTTVIGLDYAF